MRGGANPLGVIFVKEAKRGKGTYRGRNHLGATRQFDSFVDIRGDDCKSASSSSSVLYISRPRGACRVCSGHGSMRRPPKVLRL